MKVALINERSQENKNEFIYKILKKVASKYHHEVFNYTIDCNAIDYVESGILTGILLNSKAVDFVISGCATGQGFLISANKMPNVYCGYVKNSIDALLFLKINGGNAISIPFGQIFGMGTDVNLEEIFTTLFTVEAKSGYPINRKEIQEEQRNTLTNICLNNECAMIDILQSLDKEKLRKIVANEYFEENFFANSENDIINEYLLEIIDNKEE